MDNRQSLRMAPGGKCADKGSATREHKVKHALLHSVQHVCRQLLITQCVTVANQ